METKSDQIDTQQTTPLKETSEYPHVLHIDDYSDLSSEYIGKYVKLHGWVYSARSQGAGTLVFVDFAKETSLDPLRGVAHKPKPKPTDTDADICYGSTELFDGAPSSDESEYKFLTFDEMGESRCLSVGCSIMIYGKIATPPSGTTQKFEIKILKLFVIGGVQDPKTYPIQKSILKKLTSLRSHYHSRFRAPLMQHLMKIRSEALFAVHEFMHSEGIDLLDPNIMTSSDCEGAGEVFKVTPQFFSSKALAEYDKLKYDKLTTGVDKEEKDKEPSDESKDSTTYKYSEVGLTVSSQLPLEAIAMGTGQVYTCQKSFRAEESDTSKHLAEFLHVEYEKYFITLDELLDFTERFIKHLIKTVLARCSTQYDFLDNTKKSPPELHNHRLYLESLLDKPFVRIKHHDAITAMQQDLRAKVKVIGVSGKEVRLKFKEHPTHGQDLGAEHEKYLVQKFGTFVFVTHWPSDIKSFYMKQVGDGTCESFDCLAPLVGELFGGSMREWRYSVLEKEMEKRGMDMSSLQWFVDLRKDGTAPHGGWGMGFDRLVMFLTGVSSVRDVVPYPVYYGHCPY
jgi:asparaginyl-tRNA synthetase